MTPDHEFSNTLAAVYAVLLPVAGLVSLALHNPGPIVGAAIAAALSLPLVRAMERWL